MADLIKEEEQAAASAQLSKRQSSAKKARQKQRKQVQASHSPAGQTVGRPFCRNLWHGTAIGCSAEHQACVKLLDSVAKHAVV